MRHSFGAFVLGQYPARPKNLGRRLLFLPQLYAVLPTAVVPGAVRPATNHSGELLHCVIYIVVGANKKGY